MPIRLEKMVGEKREHCECCATRFEHLDDQLEALQDQLLKFTMDGTTRNIMLVYFILVICTVNNIFYVFLSYCLTLFDELNGGQIV